MAICIKIRRDTTDNWNTHNPVLRNGEFALDTNTRIIKIGNGVDNWNTLSVIGKNGIDCSPSSSSTGYVDDAPHDDKIYIRNNGAWIRFYGA